MVFHNALDFYDQTVVKKLQSKFNTVKDTKWIVAPSDLAIRLAKEQYGTDRIFPLYSVFRIQPPLPVESTSLVNYRNEFLINNNQSIKQLMVGLEYQLDFWSKRMFDMNMSVIDYYKFKVDSTFIYDDFEDLGINELVESYQTPVFLDDPEDNSSIDDIYNTGRYFRYTYVFRIWGFIFDIIDKIELKEFVLGVYHTEDDPNNLLFEKEIVINE